jgi:hypothetical protein
MKGYMDLYDVADYLAITPDQFRAINREKPLVNQSWNASKGSKNKWWFLKEDVDRWVKQPMVAKMLDTMRARIEKRYLEYSRYMKQMHGTQELEN